MRPGGWAAATGLLGLLLAIPLPSSAQPVASGGWLDRVEAAADSGRLEEARRDLDEWFARAREDAPPPQVSRARYLRARLAEDPRTAELGYLQVAIAGDDPEYGARARLRLAQLWLSRGDTARAERSLDRLRRDFPGQASVAESWLWTARIRRAVGEREGACSALRRAATIGGERERPSVTGRAREGLATCEGREAPAETLPAYAVQVGAFRSPETAEMLRRRVEAAGFEARIREVADAEGTLHRVRVGRFAEEERAREVAAKLEEEGFPTLVITLEVSPER